jgi:hypothetical protein
MTSPGAPVDTPPASTVVPVAAPPTLAPPSRRWLLAALLLAGAAQLITISALVSADPLAVTWWSLLLAIAPAPLAAAAASAPVPVNGLAALADLLVMVAGIAGGIMHIGLFFVPALVALAIGSVGLWRERS